MKKYSVWFIFCILTRLEKYSNNKHFLIYDNSILLAYFTLCMNGILPFYVYYTSRYIIYWKMAFSHNKGLSSSKIYMYLLLLTKYFMHIHACFFIFGIWTHTERNEHVYDTINLCNPSVSTMELDTCAAYGVLKNERKNM